MIPVCYHLLTRFDLWCTFRQESSTAEIQTYSFIPENIMSKKEVFIVDDEISILNLFKESFERKGYAIRTAETAEEALEILKTEQFKIMFLDLLLPGMDGMDLCREIRKSDPDTLIFAITGHAEQFELNACLDVGFSGYFLKPINLKVLCEIAEEAFNK